MQKLAYQTPDDLAEYIELHCISVLGYSADKITVESVYTKDGKAMYVEETVDATWQAVRDYLGY